MGLVPEEWQYVSVHPLPVWPAPSSHCVPGTIPTLIFGVEVKIDKHIPSHYLQSLSDQLAMVFSYNSDMFSTLY